MKIKSTIFSFCLALVTNMALAQETTPMQLPPLLQDSVSFYVKDKLVTIHRGGDASKDQIQTKYLSEIPEQSKGNFADAMDITVNALVVLNRNNSEAIRYQSMAKMIRVSTANPDIRFHEEHRDVIDIWTLVYGRDLDGFQAHWEENFPLVQSLSEGYNYDTIPIIVNGTTIYIVSNDVANLEQVAISTALTEMVQLAKEIIITAETGNAEIDRLLKTGAIDEAEAADMREGLNNDLADMIVALENMADQNEGIELGEDLSTWADAWKNEDSETWDDDDFDFDDIWSDFKIRKNFKKVTPKRTTWETDLFFGLNTFLDENNAQLDGEQELNLWGSNQVYFGFNGLTALGSISSPFKIRYGIGYYWHRFSFNRNTILVQNENEVTFGENDQLNQLDRSYFRTRYLHIPVMLQFDRRNSSLESSNWVFGLGGYASVRTWSKMQYQGQDPIGNRVTVENRGNYFVNDLRYGLQAQIGYDDFRLGVEYDLNPVFRNGRGPDLTRVAIVLGWSM
ncbi:MAG: PorT family protein [Schleiferiaceae bacterium]|nr:PorT family protein [Schleiferiaceae bacterium]